MTRALSQLIYTPFQPGEGGRSVITMHRHDAFADQMRETGLAINPNGRVIGLQSSKGVYIGRDVVGYTWYIGPLHQPSPIFFGDALSDIERFLWDEIDRGEADRHGLPFLVGVEQGAIMALATALAVPDLLSGVIAIDASFPDVSGWEPPLAPLENLPILLVKPAVVESLPAGLLTGEALTAQFADWGAEVTVENAGSDELLTGKIAEWLERQPVRFRLD